MKNIAGALFLILVLNIQIFSQEKSSSEIAIKLIPQAGFKIGSQRPAIGGQFELVAGLLIKDKYLVGLGGGYCTDMGVGGATYPLYLNGIFYFSTKNNFIFKNKDVQNDFLLETRIGLDINNNKPFKTGSIIAGGLSYHFDFLTLRESKFPTFYAGFLIEYHHSPFKDEYRGYLVKDGYLNHLILNLKVAFDIKAFKVQ